MRCQLIASLVGAACVCSPAAAQLEGKTCLVFRRIGSGGAQSAASQLGMDVTVVSKDTDFYTVLPTKQWDLVAIDIPDDDNISNKAMFIQSITDWIDGGGRLLFNLSNLDEYPGLWAPLGVAGTKEKTTPSNIFARDPGNPIFAGGIAGISFDAWDDNGDELTLAPGAYECAAFSEIGEPSAAVVFNDLRTICNGFDWDSVGTSAGAHEEILYLFACKGDFDGDGELTVFDFLDFINTFFATPVWFCNMNFDTSIDVFDFIEFQNLFAKGCQE